MGRRFTLKPRHEATPLLNAYRDLVKALEGLLATAYIVRGANWADRVRKARTKVELLESGIEDEE